MSYIINNGIPYGVAKVNVNVKNDVSGEFTSPNPNLLINGDFQVWQRGEEFQTTVAETYNYNSDRWCHHTNTESKLVKKDENGIYTETGLYQFLEDRLKVGEYYVLSASINGEIHTLNIIGGTTSTNNDLLKYFVDTNFDRIGIELGDFANVVVNWVKLEQGLLATPFVPRVYSEELMLCQRYYYPTKLHDTVGYCGSTKIVYLSVPQINNMRETLTIKYDFEELAMVSYNNYYTVKVTNVYKAEENEIAIISNYSSTPNLPVGVSIGSDKHLIVDAEIYG